MAKEGPLLIPAQCGEAGFLCTSGADAVCFRFVLQEVGDSPGSVHCFPLGRGAGATMGGGHRTQADRGSLGWAERGKTGLKCLKEGSKEAQA